MTRGWFGKDWGAPLCRDTPQGETPVGESCAWCGEVIAEGDRGVLIPHLVEDVQLVPFKQMVHAANDRTYMAFNMVRQ